MCYQKGFYVQQCLIGMIEKAKGITDKDGHFSALLTDLSKAFSCLPYDLIIAKLDACGFEFYTFCLENKKQKQIHPPAFFKILSVEFHNVLCWVLCYLTFFLQIFLLFALLKLQTMPMTTHHTQWEIVLKTL